MMGQETAISWTDATWNPLRGCTKVSEGCRNCYAMGVAARFSGLGQPYEGLARMVGGKAQWTNQILLVPDKLDEPIRWQKPRRIFVNSMSDLFHPDVPVDYIVRVWAAMCLAPHHTFQILTKRPERMRDVLTTPLFYERVLAAAHDFRAKRPKLGGVPISDPRKHPAKHIWLGTSIESDEHRDRADRLREVPAVVRFLSCEPLLGPIFNLDLDGIHWVICGGESGPHYRPMAQGWAMHLRDLCVARQVAFFFKQSSGRRAGTAPWVWDGWGNRWQWHQYPGALRPPVLLKEAV